MKIIKRLSSILCFLLIFSMFTACGNTSPATTATPTTPTVTAGSSPTPEVIVPTASPVITEQPVLTPTPLPERDNAKKWVEDWDSKNGYTGGNDKVSTVSKYALDKFEESVVALMQSDTVDDCKKFTYEQIRELVKSAITEAGGLEGIVYNKDVVVIKPNIVSFTDYTLPSWGGKELTPEVNGNATDWRVIKAVASIIREINPDGKIFVIEGSAYDTKTGYNKLKYTKENIPEVDGFYAMEDVSGEYRDYESPNLVKVNLEDGIYNKEYYVNRLIYECDAYICIPTLKNHWDACVTGSVKNIGIGGTPTNIYGISNDNNGRNNMVDHNTVHLHEWIADFYECRPADFTITDGLQGLENGPTPSYDRSKVTDIATCQKNMRLILAGKDAVAVDTVATNIMCWNIDTVLYLKYLNDKGIGNTKVEKITVKGNRTVDDVRTPFEGVIPKVSGAKLTDFMPPKLQNVSAAYDNGKIKISLTTDSTCKKVEVYTDGKLAASAIDSFDSITFEDNTSTTTSEIKVMVYDYFMNNRAVTVELKK